MDFSLSDEERAIRDTARTFIRKEVAAFEDEVLRHESMANGVVDRVMQIHGGMGYTRELPIERWDRQVRRFRIFEGTDEMLRLNISRDLLRGYTQIGGHLA